MPDAPRSKFSPASQAFADALHELLQDRAHIRHPETGKRRWTPTALADELRVDATLVRRWLRGVSVPPLSRPYVARIADILALSADERRRLEMALMTAHGSPEHAATSRARETGTTAVGRLTTSLTNFEQPSEAAAGFAPTVSSLSDTGDLPKSGEVIRDPSQVIWVCIQLFLAAAAKPQKKLRKESRNHPQSTEQLASGTIYLTYHGAQSLVGAEQMSLWWTQALCAALEEGWGLWHALRLDRTNPSRTIEIVESMLAYLVLSNGHIPYYRYDPLDVPYDIVLVPGIGAVICFATQSSSQVDSALFVSEPEQLALLEAHVRLLCASSTPLLRRIVHAADAKDRPFTQALAEIEQYAGGLDIVKPDGLGALTRPPSFYNEQSIFMRDLSPEARRTRIAHMSARWKAFERHAHDYPYRVICTKRAVLRYARTRVLARDDTDLAWTGKAQVWPSWQDVREHLKRAVQILEDRTLRYELALLDDDEADLIGTSQWEVAGDHRVLLEIFPKKVGDRPDEKAEATDLKEVDLEIAEPTIVRAFRDYFNQLWNQIRPSNRDKDENVKWLQRRIAELEHEHPEVLNN